jgi:hypothetical protein
VKVSIRTAHRIVKKTEDPESDSIFVPQYQEEGSEDWHNFRIPIKGRGAGYNTVYFYVLSKAIDYLELQKALEDAVVYYEDKTGEWSENLPYGP